MPTLPVVDTLFSMESPATVLQVSKCGDSVADCVSVMDQAGISKVVLSPCRRSSCERHWVCGDIQTNEVQQCVAAYPERFAGLAAYNPLAISESFQEISKAVREWDFRGVYVPWERGAVKLQDACMYPLYALCVDLNVPVMVAVGDMPGSALKTLGAMRTILTDFPELTVILAWPAAADVNFILAACKQHPTISVAFDGRVAEGQESKLAAWLSNEGEFRCMWGSNGLPVKPLMQHLRSYSLPDAVLKSFLHDNAVRAFRLSRGIESAGFVNDRIIVAE